MSASATPTGTNVVPLSKSAVPAAAVPWAPTLPPPGWQTAPGCCPPSGMTNLMQCYCDIQAAMAFIGKIMIDLINNDPAVTQAIIDAITKSGSNLPTIGVTNGTPAAPGQVGEYVRMQTTVNILATAQTQSISMGVLEPGDWDCWLFCAPGGWTADIQMYLDPLPAGFVDASYAILGDQGPVPISAQSSAVQGLISVPTLIVVKLATNVSGNGQGPLQAEVIFYARRRR